MRQIKASEIKPGMEIRFDYGGWDVKGTVARVNQRLHGAWLYTDQELELSLEPDSPVTVVSEPQPEEPTAFGARVVAGGRRGVRLDNSAEPWWVGDTGWCSWVDLCYFGQVTVVDADPSWETPTAPEQS